MTPRLSNAIQEFKIAAEIELDDLETKIEKEESREEIDEEKLEKLTNYNDSITATLEAIEEIEE